MTAGSPQITCASAAAQLRQQPVQLAGRRGRDYVLTEHLPVQLIGFVTVDEVDCKPGEVP